MTDPGGMDGTNISMVWQYVSMAASMCHILEIHGINRMPEFKVLTAGHWNAAHVL